MKRIVSLLLVFALLLVNVGVFAETGEKELSLEEQYKIAVKQVRSSTQGDKEMRETLLNALEEKYNSISTGMHISNSEGGIVMYSQEPGPGNGSYFAKYPYTETAFAREQGETAMRIFHGAVITIGSGGLLSYFTGLQMIPLVTEFFNGQTWLVVQASFLAGFGIYETITMEELQNGTYYKGDIYYYWTNETTFEFKGIQIEYLYLGSKKISPMLSHTFYGDLLED